MLLTLLVCFTTRAGEVTSTWVAADQGYNNKDEVAEFTIDDVITVTLDKASGSTAPAYYTTGSGIRLYTNNTFEMAGKDNITITKVVFTTTGDNSGLQPNDPDNGSFTESTTTSATWEGEAGSFKFSRGGTKHARIQKVEVTYTTSGEVVEKPSLKVSDVNFGAVQLSATQTATVTAQNLEADITATWATGGIFTCPASMSAEGGELTITLAATTKGIYSDVLTLTSGNTTATAKVSAILANYDHAGTQEDPYSVSDAIILANANGSSSDVDVYVNGYICDDPSYNSSYDTYTFSITESEDLTGDKFKIYAVSSTYTDLQKGYEVVVCAPVMMYNTTPETNKGNITSVSIGSATQKVDPELSWSAETFTYTIGGDNDAFPTLSNEYELPVTYSSSDETIATIDADGVVTVNGVEGSTNIYAEFAGDDVYLERSVMYTLTVVDPNNIYDLLNADNLGITTSYKDYEYTSNGNHYVAYAYKQNGIQLNSNSGHEQSSIILTENANGYAVKNIEIAANSISSKVPVVVIGRNTPITSTTEIADTEDRTTLGDVIVTLTSNDNGKTVSVAPTKEYRYICICPKTKTGGASQLTSVKIYWKEAETTPCGDFAIYNEQTDAVGENEINADGTASSIVLTDGFDYQLPDGLTVTAEQASYSRTINGANWQAICLPFAVAAADRADYQVIRIFEKQETASEIIFIKLDDNEPMGAGVPYLIKPADETVSTLSLTANNVTLCADPQTVVLEYFNFAGTFNSIELENNDEHFVYGLKDGAFVHAGNAGPKTMKGFRAYIDIPMMVSPLLQIRIYDSVDAIRTINTDNMQQGVFYNIKGQRVDNPTPGIYIFNGNKVVIK